MEHLPGIEPGIKVLQSFAFPLGYRCMAVPKGVEPSSPGRQPGIIAVIRRNHSRNGRLCSFVTVLSGPGSAIELHSYGGPGWSCTTGVSCMADLQSAGFAAALLSLMATNAGFEPADEPSPSPAFETGTISLTLSIRH